MPAKRGTARSAGRARWNCPCGSFPPSLPLARHCELDAHPAHAVGGADRLRDLDVELIDEQKRHSGLEVVKQTLQAELLDLAAHQELHGAALGADDVDLRGLHGAAGLA